MQSPSAELPEVSTYVPGGQLLQLILEFVENWPAEQDVHVLAPMLPRIFVTDPGGHSAQALMLMPPSVLAYRPGSQLIHAVCCSAGWYLPTAHSVQLALD